MAQKDSSYQFQKILMNTSMNVFTESIWGAFPKSNYGRKFRCHQ